MSKKGFDISYVQSNLSVSDFQSALNAGWEFVIIRLGTVYRGALYTDQQFESKYKNATKAGLKVGIYFYGMAKSVSEAQAEAKYTLKVLNKRHLDYPVFYDFEDPSQAGLSPQLSTDICEAFCKVIEGAGYAAGVYSTYNWLTNKLKPIDKKYNVWLAQYPKATYEGRYEMHQYSSIVTVPGIAKRTDVSVSNLAYGSYPQVKSTKTVAKTNPPPAEKEKEKTEAKPKVTSITFPVLPKRGYFKKGDQSKQVKILQQLLNQKKYDCGVADGIFGDKTLKGVKAFQKANKLTVDGLFGIKSLIKLKQLYK